MGSVSNYLIGPNPAHWHTNVPNFGAVRYRGVYPGVDLLFHGGEGRLEYDFDLAPGADPESIRIAFDGVDALSLGPDGALRLAIGGGLLTQPAPGIFRNVVGGKEPVAGGYQLLNSHEVGFRVGHTSTGLLIDPVLIYSTYLGGSVGEDAYALAVDTAGNAYLTGDSVSPDFPTKNAFQSVYKGKTGQFAFHGNAFVTKFDSAGSSLVYSTYLGGTADGGDGDFGIGIAVDDAGMVSVFGETDTSDFPVTDDGYQLAPRGPGSAFLSQLDSTGSNLRYSTYLGGDGYVEATAVAVDPSGKVYLCGSYNSSDFPFVKPVETTPPRRGGTTAFLAGLDPLVPGAPGLFVSTFLGGGNARAYALAVDALGRVYVGGSGDPPGVISGQQTPNDGGAYVIRLADAGTSIDYARTIGGGITIGIAVDQSGAAYLAGDTSDWSFPTTPGTVQPVNPHRDALYKDEVFVAKLSADGTTWEYSTYLGGIDRTGATGVALNPGCASSCAVTVIGYTDSADFPTVQPVPAWGDFDAGTNSFGSSDFLSQLDATASKLTFSTPMFMSMAAVAVDRSSNVYVAGGPGNQMLLLNPFQVASGVTLAKIGAAAPGPTVTSVVPPSGSILGGTSITVTGGYFGTGTTVSLGGAKATAVQLLSATQMSAVTAAHSAGTVGVTIVNLDGQSAVLAAGYTYVDAGMEDAGIVATSSGCGCGNGGSPMGGVTLFVGSAILLKVAGRRPGARRGHRASRQGEKRR